MILPERTAHDMTHNRDVRKRRALELQEGDLAASFAHDELRLTGTADSSVATALHELVTTIHTDAVAAKVRELHVDVSALEFMNASSFNVFAVWVQTIAALAPGARYRLRLTLNARLRWQQRSFGTLARVAPTIVVLVS